MNNKDTNVILSVIMPLFNVEKTLNIALDSILMQQLDYKYEIIAVDDASKDNTLKILQNYQKQHPKIIKIIKHSKNQGNAISFYDALSIAKGKYLCLI